MKLYIHDLGYIVALGIEGSTTEIQLQFNSFFNYGAVDNGELHWLTDTFAYVYSDYKRLDKYLFESSLFKLLWDLEERFNESVWKQKKTPHGHLMITPTLERIAKEMAKERRLKFEKTYFITIEKPTFHEYYSSYEPKTVTVT